MGFLRVNLLNTFFFFVASYNEHMLLGKKWSWSLGMRKAEKWLREKFKMLAFKKLWSYHLSKKIVWLPDHFIFSVESWIWVCWMWMNLVKYDDDDVINEWDPCYIIGDMAHSILVDFFWYLQPLLDLVFSRVLLFMQLERAWKHVSHRSYASLCENIGGPCN